MHFSIGRYHSCWRSWISAESPVLLSSNLLLCVHNEHLMLRSQSRNLVPLEFFGVGASSAVASIAEQNVDPCCLLLSDVSRTVYDVMTTLVFLRKHDCRHKASSIHVRCAHTEVRLCIVQLSCVCLWTNGKKTTNKERTMLVYNFHVMYILSRVED